MINCFTQAESGDCLILMLFFTVADPFNVSFPTFDKFPQRSDGSLLMNSLNPSQLMT
jgi:hypothetical protein